MQIGERGRCMYRERRAGGEERAADWTSAGGSNAQAFDAEWQEAAARRSLDRIPFLGGGGGAPSLGRPSAQAPSFEERETARRGNLAYQAQTQRVLRQARGLRPPPREPSAGHRIRSDRGNDDDTALAMRFARLENETLWS